MMDATEGKAQAVAVLTKYFEAVWAASGWGKNEAQLSFDVARLVDGLVAAAQPEAPAAPAPKGRGK